jgi:hypothetical protein
MFRTAASILFLAFTVPSVPASGPTEAPPPEFSNILRLAQIDTALVVQSQAVTNHPLWSPDSQSLGINVSGKWFTVVPSKLTYATGQWHGVHIAVNQAPPTTPLDTKDVTLWARQIHTHPDTITTKDGTILTFKKVGAKTSFIVTEPGAEPQTIWTSATESCHDLSLSPDEKLVAYICTVNGVMISDIFSLTAVQDLSTT